jgi:hypothetical protein
MALGTAGLIEAADPAYVGTWKVNLAKSSFGGPALVYAALPGGRLKSTRGTQSYEFALDGKEYKTWFGSTSWKANGTNKWLQQSTITDGSKFVGEITLSSDGNTLTVTSKGTPAKGGQAASTTETYRRISGGPGLVGAWGLSRSSAETLILSTAASGETTLASVEEKASCTAKFDGKDYAAKGPSMGDVMCVFSKNGQNGFDVTWKYPGLPIGHDSIAVSADGRTLTVTSNGPQIPENTRVVYDRVK